MADAQQTLFQRLKNLFSTGAVVRHVGGKKLKVVDTDYIQSYMSNAYRDRYSRIFSTAGFGNTYGNQYGVNMAYQTQRIMLFREYDLMDQDPILHCIDGNTNIMTLEGPQSIRDLTSRYSNGEHFEVWSWDHIGCKYTIGQAHHPRKTGHGEIIEVELDNGQILKCTDNHALMLYDGTYQEAGKCTIGERLMPFSYNYDDKNYLRIRTASGKYKAAHRYILSELFEQDIDEMHIHHINHNKLDNRSSNLQIMSPQDHMNHHGISPISNNRRSISSAELWKDDDYRNKALSGLKKWQASDEGKQFMSEHASRLNITRWKTNIDYATKMASIFSNHAKSLWADPVWATWKRAQHSYAIKMRYANDSTLKDRIKHVGSSNGRYKPEITNEWILAEGIKYNSIKEFALHEKFSQLGIKQSMHIVQFIRRRLNEVGYKSWNDYKASYQYSNHKIVDIRHTGELVDVYDLTVDHFENFAIENGIIIKNSALDIYADESTVHNEFGEILAIECDDEAVKEILQNLFYDILNIEFSLWTWMRNMVKYGDQFMFLEIAPEYGVINIHQLSVYDTIRCEGEDKDNPRYTYFQTMGMNGQKTKLEQYEVAHFRLMSDSNFLPYGRAMLEGARRVWKQLTLMEDAMLVHRIMRAPEKRVIQIDVGNIPPAEVDAYMQNLSTKMKKIPFVDPQTGDYNLRYNMMNLLEDFYIPVRGGDSGTKIENLSGLEFNSIDDIEYLRNRMMAALKIPKAFLGYDESLNGKLTLAAEDVRFARTIERLQKIIVHELQKIAIIHLYAQGYKDEELVNFKLKLTMPSTIYEQERLNLWKEKVQVASDMKALKMISDDWIYKKIFNFSEDEIVTQRKNVVEDIKTAFRYTQIESGQSDPVKYGFPQDEPPPTQPTDDGMGGAPPEGPVGESAQPGPGRPVVGMKYGQDSHPQGRDPVGADGRYDVIKHSKQDTRKPSKKSPLSTEMKQALDLKLNKSVKLIADNTILSDAPSDVGTFLDESVIQQKNIEHYVDGIE